WFFDDVAGLESALVLRLGAHVLDLWREVGATPPTDDVLDVLAQAHSNEPRNGTGADVLRRVARERITPALAVAAMAFEALAATARFADRPVTPAHCRAALDLARALGSLSPAEAMAISARFSDMLLDLLRSPPSALATEAVWELAGELLERADLGHHGDEA